MFAMLPCVVPAAGKRARHKSLSPLAQRLYSGTRQHIGALAPGSLVIAGEDFALKMLCRSDDRVPIAYPVLTARSAAK